MRKKVGEKREILARRLANSGVPLAIKREDEDSALRMRQFGGLLENSAFDLSCGATGFIINISITITQNAFAIADLALELPWADQALSLVGDPLESVSPYEDYGFPGTRALAFGRDAVINHRVNARRPLPYGATIEGLSLWVGLEPIPKAFVHGASFPATIIVVDQFGNRYPYEVTLWADRGGRGVGEKREEKYQAKKTKPQLLDQPDPVPLSVVGRSAELGPIPKAPRRRGSLFEKPDNPPVEKSPSGNLLREVTDCRAHCPERGFPPERRLQPAPKPNSKIRVLQDLPRSEKHRQGMA